jgi:hypothetical protein
MPNVIYEMGGVSADGYIVGPDGKFDWSTPDEELHRFHNEQTRALACRLLGRRLYESVRVRADLQALPKMVFSRTLDSVEGANTTLVRDDLGAELTSLPTTAGAARPAREAVRPAARQPVTGNGDHHDSHINHHRGVRYTMTHTSTTTAAFGTPCTPAPRSPSRRSALPTCSPRASGCRSTCTSSTIPTRACWSTPA